MDPSQTYFPITQKKKRARKKIQAKISMVSFAKFLRTCPVAASEDEHDETKLLHMTSRLNKYYHWMIRYELFCEPVKMDVVTFFCGRPKVKMREN